MKVQSSVFAQLLSFVPLKHFEYLLHRYSAKHGTHSFAAWSHFAAMSDAQLTRRDGLRDLVACLNSQHSNDSLALSLKEPQYAMDATVIDLCLSFFAWADFKRHDVNAKSGVI